MLAIAALGIAGSAIGIGTYLWSLRIASVKAQTEALDGRIAGTQAQVNSLRTELVLRTRLVQQGWWAPSLGLKAPAPLQYGRDDAQIHALAEARRTDIAIKAPQPSATPAPAAQQKGYAPQARQALDTLIADIAH